MEPPSPIDTLRASAGRWASQLPGVLPGADEDGEEGAENEAAVGVRVGIRFGGARSRSWAACWGREEKAMHLLLPSHSLPSRAPLPERLEDHSER